MSKTITIHVDNHNLSKARELCSERLGFGDSPNYGTVRGFLQEAEVVPADLVIVVGTADECKAIKRVYERHAAKSDRDVEVETFEVDPPAGPVTTGEGSGNEKNLSDLTVKELEVRLETAGVDLSTLEGSGSGGKVLKADLVAAVHLAEGTDGSKEPKNAGE